MFGGASAGGGDKLRDGQVVASILGWACCHSRAPQIARSVVSAADDDWFFKNYFVPCNPNLPAEPGDEISK